MALFLHEQGYNFFNIGRLTYGELNGLVDAHNRKVEEHNREIKKASNKK